MKIGDLIVSKKHSGIHVVTGMRERFKSKSIRGLIVYNSNDEDAGQPMQTLVRYKKRYLTTGMVETMDREYESEQCELELAQTTLQRKIISLSAQIERYKQILEEYK